MVPPDGPANSGAIQILVEGRGRQGEVVLGVEESVTIELKQVAMK
jgi:hypothetical protein